MVIEREPVRSLKVSRGLTQGRSLTNSNLAKFVLARPGLPACSVVANAFERLCRLNSGTTDLHLELRDAHQSRDDRHYEQSLSPFSEEINGQLRSISTGVVANDTINPETAKGKGNYDYEADYRPKRRCSQIEK